MKKHHFLSKSTFVKVLFFGKKTYIPIFFTKNIITQKRKEVGRSYISKLFILEELEKINADFIFENLSFDIKDISLLDIHDLEIILQLIPSNTKDKIHLDIYKESLPMLASRLLKDRRTYKDDTGDDSRIYMLRLRVCKRFAYFILEREKSEIDKYLKPFIDSFSSTEETASFIEKLVSVEDSVNSYEQFWHIWTNLYPKIKELCRGRSYHLEQIVINYLLAWRWWRDGIEEWRSLKIENISLYSNASKEIGSTPAVLYSISHVLNSIGTNFQDDGIDWIHTIVEKNNSLNLGDLESNTLYYLERFLRKFIFTNRQRIRENVRLKNKVIPILDFITERGSIHGYLLRESIL